MRKDKNEEEGENIGFGLGLILILKCGFIKTFFFLQQHWPQGLQIGLPR